MNENNNEDEHLQGTVGDVVSTDDDFIVSIKDAETGEVVEIASDDIVGVSGLDDESFIKHLTIVKSTNPEMFKAAIPHIHAVWGDNPPEGIRKLLND